MNFSGREPVGFSVSKRGNIQVETVLFEFETDFGMFNEDSEKYKPIMPVSQ